MRYGLNYKKYVQNDYTHITVIMNENKACLPYLSHN